MSDADKKAVRVIARQEGDSWIANCVEYDISAQGSDLAQVRRRMEVALEVECEISLRKTGVAFGGIPEAPAIYEALFNEAEESLTSEIDFRIAA